MDGAAWLPGTGGITLTDERTLKRMRRTELSASFAQNLSINSCAAGMVAGVLLPREDDIFQANQLGTAAHGVLEKLLNLPKPERTKERAQAILHQFREDPAYAVDVFDEDLVNRIQALDPVALARWYDEVTSRVEGLWLIEDPAQVDLHSTEMAFGARYGKHALIGRAPFRGFIDRVDQVLDPETQAVVGYAVKDYKAGKYKDGGGRFGDDYGDQIRIYVMAVENYEGIRPTEGALLFIAEGKGRDIDVSDAKLAQTREAFEAAWDRMHVLARDNVYPTKVGPLCSWCPLVNACPAAIAAGKTDLSDTKKENGVRKVALGMPKKGIPAADLAHMPHLDGPAQIQLPPLELPDEILNKLSMIGAAHKSSDNESPKENKTVTDSKPNKVLDNPNPREATVGGDLNGSSYSAQHVFALSSMAVAVLTKHGRAVNAAAVSALSYTFAHIIRTVQLKYSDSSDPQDGLGARLRSALDTTIDTLPMPFGEDAAAWDRWVESATKRVSAITSVSVQLFQQRDNIPQTPWHALGDAAQAAA